jgi:uncharacterized membrane protein
MSISRKLALASGLVVLLAGSGTLHMIKPQTFDAIVPTSLPGKARTWTYLSGAAELLTALLIAAPRTRRPGGTLAALLFVAVFPANVRMARSYLRSPKTSRRAKTIAVARLPLQIPLVLAGLGVR